MESPNKSSTPLSFSVPYIDDFSSRFRLHHTFSGNGISRTRLAWDKKNSANVVIKRYFENVRDNGYTREMAVHTRIRHASIVFPIMQGKLRGDRCLVFPHDDYLNALTIPDEGFGGWRDVIRFAVSLCDALKLPHQAGIVHGDISPGNVLVRSWKRLNKLIDFGEAVADPNGPACSVAELAQRVGPRGTDGYLSPEHKNGSKPLTTRSDIYSVGCLIYKMITGEVPLLARFGYWTDEALDDIVAPKGLQAASARLMAVIEKATMPDPDQRFTSVHEMKKALLTCFHG